MGKFFLGDSELAGMGLKTQFASNVPSKILERNKGRVLTLHIGVRLQGMKWALESDSPDSNPRAAT